MEKITIPESDSLISGYGNYFNKQNTEELLNLEYFIPEYFIPEYKDLKNPTSYNYLRSSELVFPNEKLNTRTIQPLEMNSKGSLPRVYSEPELNRNKELNRNNLYTTLASLLGNRAIKAPTEGSQQSQNYLPNTFLSPILRRTIQQPFNNYLDLGAIKLEDLPEMALPVLEFMEDVQPHIVIGCDRGGRLFGLAMHAAWRNTRDGRPFPTLDGKLHFARVSKSEDSDVLQQKIDEIVEASKRFGKQRSNEVAEDEQLRVLFVDDWVIGGGTMRLAQLLMKKHDAQTYFAVMCGEGADATGKRELQTWVSWHDRPEEIGVNYLSTIQQHPDGTVSQKLQAVAVRSAKTIHNRQRIQDAARKLALARVLTEVA